MPLCTGTAIILLESIGNYTDAKVLRRKFKTALPLISTGYFGLYSVDAHRIQGMSVDNIVGFICADVGFGIYQYGKQTFWSYDCSAPYRFSLRYCVARFPGFVSFIKLSAGKEISLFGRVAIFLSAIFNTFSSRDNTSDKCLQYLLNKLLTQNSWTVRCWKYLMMRKYPGGLKELYLVYFGKDHPFTKYAPTQF